MINKYKYVILFNMYKTGFNYTIKCIKISEEKNKKMKKKNVLDYYQICFLFLSYAAILVLLVNELWLLITTNFDL